MRPSWLHDLSIRRKLVLAILAASVAAILLAGLAVAVYETATGRSQAVEGYGMILAAVVLALLAVASLVSSAIQRLVVAPIRDLAAVAQRVTAEKDYGVRARLDSGDELGALTSAFNEMLVTTEENIAERRRAEKRLREYSQQLEERVERRTRELRETQEQLLRQERLAFLGQLAGGVSHELRRPLATIGNSLYYLKTVHAGADDDTLEHLEIIRSQIHNMDKIIHDLLGSLRLRPQTVGRVELGPWLADVLARHPPPAGIAVLTDLDAELPAAWIDAAQMEQVLSNLITNAYQAMPDGGVLRLSARMADGVALAVEDTGCGIPEKHLARIFEPLFTTKSRGVGLGLTVSKNFVEANGGRLAVASVEGEGATFTIHLPANAPP